MPAWVPPLIAATLIAARPGFGSAPGFRAGSGEVLICPRTIGVPAALAPLRRAAG
jgi:hypothetical protein